MDEQKFRKVVESSLSIKETLEKLGVAPIGGNYNTFHRYVKKFNINTSHFKRIHNFTRTVDYSKMFIENSKASRSKVKSEIIKKKLIPYECQNCRLKKWLNQHISLHLDHINGIRNDNRLKNLRFLCPNCHSMTPTYCGRANKKPDKFCVDCNKKITKISIRCRKCSLKIINTKNKKETKINWPSIKELKKRLKTSNFSALSRELGISDNAIRKHLRNHS